MGRRNTGSIFVNILTILNGIYHMESTCFTILNGIYHMESTCQIVVADGPQLWFIKDKLHRENGPAVVRGWYSKWFLNGKDVTADVRNWMLTQHVTWPWNEDIQIQFMLAFC